MRVSCEKRRPWSASATCRDSVPVPDYFVFSISGRRKERKNWLVNCCLLLMILMFVIDCLALVVYLLNFNRKDKKKATAFPFERVLRHCLDVRTV